MATLLLWLILLLLCWPLALLALVLYPLVWLVLLPFRLAEGQHVEVRARVTLYEARGEFQLQAEDIREAGRGRLFEAFLRLKEKLAAEGLFAPERKRPLPALPRGIGIVTSRDAAALHDILTTLARRAPPCCSSRRRAARRPRPPAPRRA